MGKSKFVKGVKYRLIRWELIKLYGEASAEQILARAAGYYVDCAAICKDAAEGEWTHLNNTILPTAAVYKALLDTDRENALASAHTVMMNICRMGGSVMRGAMKLPGMKAAFMRLLPKMAQTMFGPSCGFQYRNYKVGKDLLQMDMTACPYCRYARMLGCPELTKVFCDSDFATYGELPGIRFERTQTLGTGGTCCDFRFTRE